MAGLVQRNSVRRQRGINPFIEMLALALIAAAIWMAIVLGKHYLGAAWWQITLYVVAGLVLSVVGVALGHYSPMLGVLALAGMVAVVVLF